MKDTTAEHYYIETRRMRCTVSFLLSVSVAGVFLIIKYQFIHIHIFHIIFILPVCMGEGTGDLLK